MKERFVGQARISMMLDLDSHDFNKKKSISLSSRYFYLLGTTSNRELASITLFLNFKLHTCAVGFLSRVITYG